jgi:hypothetical protein
MIDATHLKARQPACKKRGCSPTYRADQRWFEFETARGLRRPRPLIRLLSEGLMSDYRGAVLMLKFLSNAKALQRRGMTLTRFETPLPTARSPPAFRRGPTEGPYSA